MDFLGNNSIYLICSYKSSHAHAYTSFGMKICTVTLLQEYTGMHGFKLDNEVTFLVLFIFP